MLDTQLSTHVLTREDFIPSGQSTVPNQAISEKTLNIPKTTSVIKTDYSADSLERILKEQSIGVVVCALSATTASINTQHALIDRVSLRGSSCSFHLNLGWRPLTVRPRNKVLCLSNEKRAVIQRLQELAERGKLDWTAAVNGPFFDLCLQDGGLYVDLKK